MRNAELKRRGRSLRPAACLDRHAINSVLRIPQWREHLHLRGGVALVLLVLWRCSDFQRNTPLARSSLSMLKVDSGAKLVVALPRDTISADDNAAIEVHYYVVNGPKRITFDNNPGFYSLQVQTSEGQPVTPSNATAPVTGSIGPTRIELPARAILGQVVDLRCVRDEAGYGGDPTASDACLGGYPLHERGSYRIILEYWGPEFKWQPPETTGGRGTPAADTGGILKTIPRGRHMADTVTLMVK